jgi:xanthine dehydrogenase accessory factor
MVQLQKARRNGSADPAAVIYTAGWLAETLTPAAQPLWIWGAGHVGRAVVHIASQMPDLEVTWIDTSPDRFPDAAPQAVTLVPAENPAPLMAHAPRDAQHLIFTYAHSLDLALCHAALLRGFDFCGLIGSASKWARFQRRLMALGHAPRRFHK